LKNPIKFSGNPEEQSVYKPEKRGSLLKRNMGKKRPLFPLGQIFLDNRTGKTVQAIRAEFSLTEIESYLLELRGIPGRSPF